MANKAKKSLFLHGGIITGWRGRVNFGSRALSAFGAAEQSCKRESIMLT
jgi:hypothetical protein